MSPKDSHRQHKFQCLWERRTNNWAPIDANNEVKPWLNWKLKVGIPEDLEAIGPLFRLTLGCVAVQSGHKSIEGVEHFKNTSLSQSL